MTLVKRTNGLSPTFSNLFDDFLTRDFYDSNHQFHTTQRTSTPASNIKETDKDYTIELAVPGLKKDDFKLECDKNVLTISSEINKENQEENDGYTCKEFGFQAFTKSFRLPEDKVNVDKIKASYTDGVLSIEIPKQEVKVNPVKTIKIS